MANEFKIKNGLDLDGNNIINILNFTDGVLTVPMSTLGNKVEEILNSGSRDRAIKLHDNTMLNAFRIMSSNSLSILKMIDGIADEYIDESGVDTGVSVNQEYNGGSHYYSSAFDTTVKLLLHFDGADGTTATTDDSSSAHTINFFGNAHIEADQSKFGGTSLQLDGSGDYLSSPDSADWDIFSSGSADWVIDAWIYQNSLSTQNAIVTHFVSNSIYWTFQILTDGKLIMQMNDTSTVFTMSGGNATTGVWHHVAFIKRGTDHGLYLNGVQVAYLSSAVTKNYTGNLLIGTFNGSVSYMDGYVDELRVQNSDIFSASPNAGLTDTITVPTAPSSARGNMTLVSENFSAEFDPTEARNILLFEEVDSVIINTDIILSISKDGGTNWTQVTLIDQGNFVGARKILTATTDVDYTGLPAGTTMKYKIETLNNKQMQVHATALSWK